MYSSVAHLLACCSSSKLTRVIIAQQMVYSSASVCTFHNKVTVGVHSANCIACEHRAKISKSVSVLLQHQIRGGNRLLCLKLAMVLYKLTHSCLKITSVLLNLPFVLRIPLVASYCLSKALFSTAASLELHIFIIRTRNQKYFAIHKFPFLQKLIFAARV